MSFLSMDSGTFLLCLCFLPGAVPASSTTKEHKLET